MSLVHDLERSISASTELATENTRLRAALKEIATMKPSRIAPGFVHGPALLLSNCQRIARKALRAKS